MSILARATIASLVILALLAVLAGAGVHVRWWAFAIGGATPIGVSLAAGAFIASGERASMRRRMARDLDGAKAMRFRP